MLFQLAIGDPDWTDFCEKSVWEYIPLQGVVGEAMCDRADLALAELEHIRWSRYHYLNNWRYGMPEDGSRKDKGRRIHADLLPYRELSDNEKEKDRESVRQMLKVTTKSSA